MITEHDSLQYGTVLHRKDRGEVKNKIVGGTVKLQNMFSPPAVGYRPILRLF